MTAIGNCTSGVTSAKRTLFGDVFCPPWIQGALDVLKSRAALLIVPSALTLGPKHKIKNKRLLYQHKWFDACFALDPGQNPILGQAQETLIGKGCNSKSLDMSTCEGRTRSTGRPCALWTQAPEHRCAKILTFQSVTLDPAREPRPVPHLEAPHILNVKYLKRQNLNIRGDLSPGIQDPGAYYFTLTILTFQNTKIRAGVDLTIRHFNISKCLLLAGYRS